MNEDYNAADALLTTLEVLSEQEIKVGPNNSINFWDIRVKNGNKGTLSVQKFIRTNREQLNKVRDRRDARQGEMAVLGLAQRAAQGDANARAEFSAAVADLSPAGLKSAMSLFGVAENFGDVLGPEELGLLQEIDVAETDAEKQALRSRVQGLINNGQLGMNAGMQLLNRLNRGGSETGPTAQVLSAGRAANESGLVDTQAFEVEKALREAKQS